MYTPRKKDNTDSKREFVIRRRRDGVLQLIETIVYIVVKKEKVTVRAYLRWAPQRKENNVKIIRTETFDILRCRAHRQYARTISFSFSLPYKRSFRSIVIHNLFFFL